MPRQSTFSPKRPCGTLPRTSMSRTCLRRARESRADRMYRVGVDIGGTFTDFALFDARGAKMSVHKLLTTPHDPSEAVTAGVDALLRRDGIAIEDVGDVVHGTTLVTNAVIERKGAITGMLATAGF